MTNGQYCQFLNAKAAKHDPHGLWNSALWTRNKDMSSYANVGIIRSLNGGTYTYTVKPGGRTNQWLP